MTTNARDKIKTIDELSVIVRQIQDSGKTVVLAHGVYDLVHMGHVRHLERARSEGDVLIVTTTADRYVNKGPGRPIFTEHLRAEMLAALGYVDWVGINFAPDASNILDAIRPDVYVKGADYENPEDDITGRISEERDAVEKHGGRIVFTKDITFSSSTLINKYLGVYDRPLQDYLTALRDTSAQEEITSLIERVRDYRVVMVGDAIIDEYLYVDAMGKSAKENMIATRFREREVFAGGVFAAANHVAGFCKEVEIITTIGEIDSYEDLIRSSLKANVKLTCMARSGKPTTRKTRFIDPGYMRKLFEVYNFDDSAMDATESEWLTKQIRDKAATSDVVIVTDFGHGLMNADAISTLCEVAPFLAVNTQTNSANLGYNLITKYPRADYVCIDAPEAQLAVTDRFSDMETIVAEKLPSRIDCQRMIVTHGNQGCVTRNADGEVHRIPAFTKTVVDTVGAGDAFLAVTAPLAAAGGDMEHIGFVGNAAGAIKVGIVGHRSSIEKIPLIKYLNTLLK